MNTYRAIIDTVILLWMLILTGVALYFYRTKTRLLQMASNYASQLGRKSGAVRHEAAQSKQLASGQGKVVEMFAKQIPGASGLLKGSGINNSEAWAMVTDPNTLKGLKVIMDTLGGAAQMFSNREPGQQKDKKKRPRNTQGAPLKELKH